MLMALLMFVKWWNFTTNKKFSYIINIYFIFQKIWIRFIMISKIKLYFFSNKFKVAIFYMFNVGIIIIILKIYSLQITFFLRIFYLKFFTKKTLHFFLEFALFLSFFFQTRIVKLKKIKTIKTCWLWRGEGGGRGEGSNYIYFKVM
jgi:hypothetical protein